MPLLGNVTTTVFSTPVANRWPFVDATAQRLGVERLWRQLHRVCSLQSEVKVKALVVEQIRDHWSKPIFLAYLRSNRATVGLWLNDL